MSGVLVLGAGGHAKVVADILQAQGISVRGFLDDDPASWERRRLDLPVLGPIARLADLEPDGLVLGIGSNRVRQELVMRLAAEAAGLWRIAVHPRATLAPSVCLGVGVVIAAGAVANPDAQIGDHAIVNTGATIDHDCVIGAYAHIAPGAHLAGGVRIGVGAFLGAGAVVTPGIAVGDWAIVGAGAVVVQEIPAGVTAKGVPARW
jgi:sugar O-acyltransferase (sialic acid O-acetyltransferase NeuD family)